LNRGIGEEITKKRLRCHNGKVLEKFDVGTTPMKFICSRLRAVLLSFVVVVLIFLVIILPLGLVSPLMMLAILIITSIVMAITILVVVGMLFAMMYPLSDKILKDNWTKVTGNGITIQHKLWITTGAVRNFIPFENISRIEPIDDNYMEERRKRTKIWYRIMVLHPEPPVGGLYNYYSDPKGLVVIRLREPMPVHNLGYFGKFSLWPMPVEKVVSEVVVDIEPNHHEKFFRMVKDGMYRSQKEDMDK
jgi:hypothetical protein